MRIIFSEGELYGGMETKAAAKSQKNLPPSHKDTKLNVGTVARPSKMKKQKNHHGDTEDTPACRYAGRKISVTGY